MGNPYESPEHSGREEHRPPLSFVRQVSSLGFALAGLYLVFFVVFVPWEMAFDVSPERPAPSVLERLFGPVLLLLALLLISAAWRIRRT